MMKPRKCKTKYCQNDAAKNRTICHKCRSRKYKQSSPFRYYYNAHKQAAKRRHIPWRLSFLEFKRLWQDSGKWEEKLEGVPWTMHRKDVNEGYYFENLEIVSVYLNVELWYEYDRWQIDFRWRKRWSEIHGKPVEDCPF